MVVRIVPTHLLKIFTRLVDWRQDAAIDTVAMESTGVYGIPFSDSQVRVGFGLLWSKPNTGSSRSRERKVRRVGLSMVQYLHSVGLLKPLFVTTGRLRVTFFAACIAKVWFRWPACTVQHMHKALDQMNLPDSPRD